MRISELTAFAVQLPLRRELTHASHTRHASQNMIVRCRLGDGTIGWGEGVPREYVTGETTEGAFEQLKAMPLSQQLSNDCQSWLDVIQLCDAFQPERQASDARNCGSNALRCAVELSVLDAFGRLFGEPVSAIASHVHETRNILASHDWVRYSATIMSEGTRRERISALKMRTYGFAQCKVKVGVPGSDDPARLERIRWWIGREIDLRLDANEAWRADKAREHIEPLLKYRVTCIEQPVPHEEVDALCEIRKQIACPVMLDESLTSLVDGQRAVDTETCDMFNIRLSKCGGFLNSLRLAAFATRNKIGYQLGCHPGESGILSAAGRHWASSVSGVRYLEGSYDRHVLKRLPTNEDITFRYGGWAPALSGPGLGITVIPSVLDEITTRQETFRWD